MNNIFSFLKQLIHS